MSDNTPDTFEEWQAVRRLQRWPKPLEREVWDAGHKAGRASRDEEVQLLQESSKLLGDQLEFDRSAVADGVTAIKKSIDGRFWLTEGRGPYEWNDDNWHEEFHATAVEILDSLDPLVKIAADWKGCPQITAEVVAARRDLRSQIQELKSTLSETDKLDSKNAAQMEKLLIEREELRAQVQLLREVQDSNLNELTAARKQIAAMNTEVDDSLASAGGAVIALQAQIQALEASAREIDREECPNCKATRWEHSPEQWAYCQGKLAALRKVNEGLVEALRHGRDEVANPDFDSAGDRIQVDTVRLAVIDAALALAGARSQEKGK